MFVFLKNRQCVVVWTVINTDYLELYTCNCLWQYTVKAPLKIFFNIMAWYNDGYCVQNINKSIFECGKCNITLIAVYTVDAFLRCDVRKRIVRNPYQYSGKHIWVSYRIQPAVLSGSDQLRDAINGCWQNRYTVREALDCAQGAAFIFRCQNACGDIMAVSPRWALPSGKGYEVVKLQLVGKLLKLVKLFSGSDYAKLPWLVGMSLIDNTDSMYDCLDMLFCWQSSDELKGAFSFVIFSLRGIFLGEYRVMSDVYPGSRIVCQYYVCRFLRYT